MVKLALTCVAILTWVMAVSFAASAEEQRDRVQHPVELAPQLVRLPGSDFDVAVGLTVLDQSSMQIEPKLINAIALWLSKSFDLPLIAEPPRIAFVPAKLIGALRYGSNNNPLGDSHDVVAVYVDANETIYLPRGWTGTTPTELSILVHEMVHHLQNLAGIKFACPEEREKLAYEAQRAWLALFGRSLFRDFETDPFTLLVRTQCPI